MKAVAVFPGAREVSLITLDERRLTGLFSLDAYRAVLLERPPGVKRALTL